MQISSRKGLRPKNAVENALRRIDLSAIWGRIGGPRGCDGDLEIT